MIACYTMPLIKDFYFHDVVKVFDKVDHGWLVRKCQMKAFPKCAAGTN